ncbi:hypothetical protein HKX48_008527 [Thoreauomyces humboldtii]|nr:hypothetical protein HKX48_008527 [Thoreauomyces humboldtii]
MQVHNSKFVQLLITHPTNNTADDFLSAALQCAFTLLPQTRYIGYFLPSGTAIFAPLVPPAATPTGHTDLADGPPPPRKKAPKVFVDVPAAGGAPPNNRLLLCSRKDILPGLRIRDARVEDADDLVPMFKEQNLIGENEQADFYLAHLLESQTETIKTLVAEADGRVIGFISLDSDIQQASLVETFDLDPFDSLAKDPRPRRKKPATPPPPPAPQTPLPEEQEQIQSDEDDNDHVVDPAPVEEPLPVESDTLNVTSPLSATPLSTSRPASVPVSSHTPPRSPSATTSEPAQDDGEPNAFCISLFSMSPEYERQSGDLVKAAFLAFPERDYCVVTLAAARTPPALVAGFTSVPARVGSSDRHCLYLTNRFAALDGVVAVSRANRDSIDAVGTFLDDVPSHDEILSAFSDAVDAHDGERSQAFTIEAGDPSQLVGIVVTSGLVEAQARKPWTDQFDTAAVPGGHEVFAKLERIVINPLFEHQARWVLEEVMRQTGLRSLVHAAEQYVDDGIVPTDASTRAFTTREFVPVRPRREIEFPNGIRDGVPLAPPLPYALRMLTMPLLYEPRVAVNTRIVVMGASDCGIGFLETLAYNPHLRFANVTLVSTAGAPCAAYVSRRCYSDVEFGQLGLAEYVKIVRGTVAEVDRLEKRCQLTNTSLINYDYLVLAPGLQFNTKSLGAAAGKVHGVVALNAAEHAALDVVVTHALQARIPALFVYGRDLKAFAGVQVLLEAGVPASQITLIVPPARLPASCFDNAVLDVKMREILQSLGVSVLDNWSLERIEAEHGAMTGLELVFRETGERKTLTGRALIYADERSVSPPTFRCINDSCLVFDGQLVVDSQFRTQDDSVFAAGSITKYSSRYQTTWSHALCDSRQVGETLGKLLLPLFDPTSADLSGANTVFSKAADQGRDLLEFPAAKKTLAIMPGNLQYFHFDQPRLLSHTLAFRSAQPDYGRDLVIDSLSADTATTGGSYFRIHVDDNGHIRSLTYLGSRRIPVGNMLCLYGLHEKYLNNLVARFDEGIIEDFITFFEGDWALPIFYDRFPDFAQDLDEELQGLRESDGKDGAMAEVLDALAEKLDVGVKLSEGEQRGLYRAFDNDKGRKVLDKKVFDYLLESEIYRSFP